MKLRTNNPIPNPIDLELKHQPRTVNPHIEGKIQIVKLHALGRRQPCKQGFRHAVQVGGEGAHVDEALAVRVGRDVGVAGDEVVFDDEGLAGPEVARVVEGYGLRFGDLCALEWVC
jgi:hypothetical protein